MPIIHHFPAGSATTGSGIYVSAVSNILAQTSSGKVYIKWTDPEDAIFDDTTFAVWSGTLLVRKAGSMPTNRKDGTIVLDSKIRNQYQDSYFCDSGLSDGITYYYKFYPYTELEDYTESEENEFYATPNPVLLSNVSNISANSAGSGKLALKWTDSTPAVIRDGLTLATWSSTKVVYRTDRYPTSPDDGTLVINNNTHNGYSSSPYIIDRLNNGKTYYIAFFPVSTDGAVTIDSENRVSGIPNRISINVVPSQSKSLVYDGNILSPSWNNYDTEKLIIGGKTSAVVAGTYIATFTPADDYQWSDGSVATKEVEWTIGKAAGSLSISPTSITLNNNNLTDIIAVTRLGDGAITAVSSDPSIVTATVNGNNITVSHVGKAHGIAVIAVKVAAGTNYTASSDKTVSVTANFPKIDTVPSQSGSLTYSGDSQSPEWDNYDPTQLSIGGDVSGVNAYTYTATFTPIGDYSWSDGSTVAKSVEWIIDRAAIPYPSTEGTLTYTGSFQSPTWSNYDSAKLTASGDISGRDAGRYLTYFTLTENYQWQDGLTGTTGVYWRINKAEGSLKLNKTMITLNSSTVSTTVTVTRPGDGAITATSSNTNVATVSVSGTTLTIKSVNNTSGSATISVSVAEGTNYTAPSGASISVTASFFPAKDTLENTSWVDIQTVSKAGQASNYWSIGDQKTLNINGTSYKIYIIGFDHDIPTDTSTYGRSKAGITFQAYDCVNKTSINSTSTNSGGWKSSILRGVLSGMQHDASAVSCSVKKTTSAGNMSSNIETTNDIIFLLSEIEVGGTSLSFSASGEGSQYAYYSQGNSKVKKYNNSTTTWWLRSPVLSGSNNYCYVANNAYGTISWAYATSNHGISFAFCI